MKKHCMAASGVTLFLAGPLALLGCMKDAVEVGNNPSAAGMSATSAGGPEASSSAGAGAGSAGTATLAGATTAGAPATGGASNGGDVVASAGVSDAGADCDTLLAERVTEYEEATSCLPNAPMDECGATYKPLIGDQCTIAVNAGAVDAVARLNDIERAIQASHCPQGTLGTCAPGTTGHCGPMGRCLLDPTN